MHTAVATPPRAPMPSELAAHLVVRYSDRMVPGINVLAQHRAVLRNTGHVWIGKVGKGLRLDLFQSQLKAGILTKYYLAKPGAGGYEFACGRMVQIQLERPIDFEDSIPAYYATHNLLPKISIWTLVKGLKAVGDTEKNGLITRSSRRPVTDSLAHSSAGAFVVEFHPKGELGSDLVRIESKRDSLKDFMLDDGFDLRDVRSLYNDV